jgi:hypothetical protein
MELPEILPRRGGFFYAKSAALFGHRPRLNGYKFIKEAGQSMKRKRYFAAILGMALLAGVFLAGCDLTTNPGNKGNPGNNDNELDGTWKYGDYEIIIYGDSYIMQASGSNYGQGTISYSVATSTFTFDATHVYDYSSGWVSAAETTNGTLTYSGGDTLIISSLDNSTYSSLENVGKTINQYRFKNHKYYRFSGKHLQW